MDWWTVYEHAKAHFDVSWGPHQMETVSALLPICAGNSPVPGEVPAQRPVTRSFDVFFDLRLNKRLGKQWWGWWFETPSLYWSDPLFLVSNTSCRIWNLIDHGLRPFIQWGIRKENILGGDPRPSIISGNEINKQTLLGIGILAIDIPMACGSVHIYVIENIKDMSRDQAWVKSRALYKFIFFFFFHLWFDTSLISFSHWHLCCHH